MDIFCFRIHSLNTTVTRLLIRTMRVYNLQRFFFSCNHYSLAPQTNTTLSVGSCKCQTGIRKTEAIIHWVKDECVNEANLLLYTRNWLVLTGKTFLFHTVQYIAISQRRLRPGNDTLRYQSREVLPSNELLGIRSPKQKSNKQN